MGRNGRMCARVVVGSGADTVGLVGGSFYQVTVDSLVKELCKECTMVGRHLLTRCHAGTENGRNGPLPLLRVLIWATWLGNLWEAICYGEEE